MPCEVGVIDSSLVAVVDGIPESALGQMVRVFLLAGHARYSM
ncbi:MAG: hypothetical protein WCI74_19440 [Actinomycetes bacterium]